MTMSARRPRSGVARGPRVGEAVAVGAERHERLRDEPADPSGTAFMKSVTATIGPRVAEHSVTYGVGAARSGAGGSNARSTRVLAE